MTQEEHWLLIEKYGGVESEAFHADCARLRAGEPLGYIIGFVPFLNTKIFLDSRPLIPRTETEHWTQHVIDEIEKIQALKPGKQIRVLDLCAGSGAIGVAVAHALPYTLVGFGEVDPSHLPTILHNLTENGVDPDRCQIMQSNLFENIDHTYDIIVSNPPYIDPALDRTEASVKTHEPHLALYGGADGMELIMRIIVEARASLAPCGQLWIEHEPEQSETIATLGTKHGYTTTTHKDQYAVERYTVLVLK